MKRIRDGTDGANKPDPYYIVTVERGGGDLFSPPRLDEILSRYNAKLDEIHQELLGRHAPMLIWDDDKLISIFDHEER
tara:strand:+ start:533 stop:766 length:234 start_codon:yes stop_codon:yes gene_type:complete